MGKYFFLAAVFLAGTSMVSADTQKTDFTSILGHSYSMPPVKGGIYGIAFDSKINSYDNVKIYLWGTHRNGKGWRLPGLALAVEQPEGFTEIRGEENPNCFVARTTGHQLKWVWLCSNGDNLEGVEKTFGFKRQ